MIKRPLKVILLTVLAYLLEVCAMPRLQIGGISGSTIFAALAILTVAYGRKAAFVSGAIIGILMETMMSNVSAYYLILYPVIAMLAAQLFADMSERQLERRRTEIEGKRKKRQTDLPPALRTIMCAGFSSLLFNVVNCGYGYISGYGFTMNHIARALTAVLYTIFITAIFLAPVRLYLGLGLNGPRQKKRKRGEEA